MWTMSSAAQDALVRPHGMSARVTITSPTGSYLELPIAGGSVTVDAGSGVRRTATITADPGFWPTSPADLLSPFGSEAFIEYGIGLPDGSFEWVPCGVFTLASTSRTRPAADTAGLTVELQDRSAKVSEDAFDAPTQTVSGATCVAEITRLIQRTLTAQTVTDRTGSTQVAPVTELDKDPWADGIEKLSTAIAAETIFNQLGVAIIRPQPTLADLPVWVYETGELGTITKLDEAWTRKAAYNRVIASGQRSDGTTPVYAAVSDTDPGSPTFYGGPFGRKPYRYSSPLLTTVAQCTTAATALLARVTGTGVQLGFEGLVNPALDVGDVVVARIDGMVSTHIIDKLNIPLSPDGLQQLGTRASDVPTTDN